MASISLSMCSTTCNLLGNQIDSSREVGYGYDLRGLSCVEGLSLLLGKVEYLDKLYNHDHRFLRRLLAMEEGLLACL